MITLTALILITFCAAIFAVIAYRSLHGIQISKRNIIFRRKNSGQMQRGGQHGFISLQLLHRSRKENVKQIKLRSPRSGISAPWGW